MFATSVYFMLKLCETGLSPGSHWATTLEVEKYIFHNYKRYHGKEILKKNITAPLCTEHPVLREKAC